MIRGPHGIPQRSRKGKPGPARADTASHVGRDRHRPLPAPHGTFGFLSGSDSRRDDRCMAMIGRKPAGLAGLTAAVYGLVLRPRMNRWGATDEEVEDTYPRS
jgi:hypothetical protein